MTRRVPPGPENGMPGVSRGYLQACEKAHLSPWTRQLPSGKGGAAPRSQASPSS
jgi:hypothetical protein